MRVTTTSLPRNLASSPISDGLIAPWTVMVPTVPSSSLTLNSLTLDTSVSFIVRPFTPIYLSHPGGQCRPPARHPLHRQRLAVPDPAALDTHQVPLLVGHQPAAAHRARWPGDAGHSPDPVLDVLPPDRRRRPRSLPRQRLEDGLVDPRLDRADGGHQLRLALAHRSQLRQRLLQQAG